MARQEPFPPEKTVRELLDVCVRLDADAWDEFVSRFNRAITFYVLRAVRVVGAPPDGSDDLVRDLVQDVYSRLLAGDCRALKAWRGGTDISFKSYLARVAGAVVCDAARRERSQKRAARTVSLDAAEPETELTLADTLPAPETTWPDRVYAERHAPERLRALLSTFSGPNASRDALIFQLHALDGLSASEIAAMPGFGMATAAVETSLRRTRERLRRAVRHPGRLTG